MLAKGRRSDSSQFIPTAWVKTLSRYLLRATDILKKHHTCLRELHVQVLKRMGKVPSWLMRPKSETSNFELLVPSKGIFYFQKYGTDEKVSAIDSKTLQLQESGTMFQPRVISSYATLHRLSRIGKQFVNMLGEYDTWSPAHSFFLIEGYQRLSCRHADQIVAKGKG